MSVYHSNSDCESILSADMVEKNLIDNKEYAEQLDKIITSKGKLVTYLSITYGAISFAGLIYLLIF
jgi:hypothetical protein